MIPVSYRAVSYAMQMSTGSRRAYAGLFAHGSSAISLLATTLCPPLHLPPFFSLTYPTLPKQRPQILQPPPRRLLLRPPLPRHRQIRQRLLLPLQIEHLLLKATLHHEPLDRDRPRLAQSMHAIHSLGLRRGVELGLHDECLVGLCEIEAEAAGADGDQDDGDGGVLVEGVEGAVAGFAGHAAVEADQGVAGVGEGDFDEVEVRGPGGEDDAGGILLVGKLGWGIGYLPLDGRFIWVGLTPRSMFLEIGQERFRLR